LHFHVKAATGKQNGGQNNDKSASLIHVYFLIFDEYTQVLAGDTTNKMAFLGGEEGASLCIALLCTIVLRSNNGLVLGRRFKKSVHILQD
jgi:hypothetical protein